jgi:hypothetical protein
MSRPISLFSGYSQRENRTTNYCLLLLKMLYEENPKFLAEVMSTLAGEDLGRRIGVSFAQQEPRGPVIPDGLIRQPAFTIYIETKNWDWFYDEQLEGQLKALKAESPGLKVLIALANFENIDSERFTRVRQLCADQYKGEIVFKEVSFEDFVQALQLPHLPKNLADAVADFRAYLDEQNLLPSWGRQLDVVNCAGIPDDVLVGNVYMCPATGGAYSHQRCKYFGMYRSRRIEKVALIEAVVDVEDLGNATVKWRNVSTSEDALKERAEAKVQQLRPNDFPTRVFLLGPLYDATDCIKDSPGGMQCSKQYFDVGSLKVDDAERLAQALSGKTWSKLRSLEERPEATSFAFE